MAAQQIRLDQKTINEFRELRKEEFSDFTDDKIVWTLILEYKRLKTENELLWMKLRECEKKNES
jgi:hypothetical protein